MRSSGKGAEGRVIHDPLHGDAKCCCADQQVSGLIIQDDDKQIPFVSVSEVDSSDRHPITRGQQALWFLHQLVRETAAYSIVTWFVSPDR